MSCFTHVRAVVGGATALLSVGACQTQPASPQGSLTELSSVLIDSPYPKTTSLIIYRGDTLVHEGYYNQGTPELLNNTRSATKTVVALAVGAAIANGDLDSALDLAMAPLARERGVVLSPLKAAITYRDLLTMSSALHCNDDGRSPGTEDNMHATEVWENFVLGLPDQPGYARDEKGLGSFRYCTAGTFWLGQALEHETGQPIDEYVAEHIFAPLGIENAEWFRSPSGEVQTGGGLELSSRDLSKLIRLVRDGGVYQGQQIVPEAWANDMATPWRDAGRGMRYGYQMWNRDYDYGCGTSTAWLMAGNGGSHMLAIKEHDLAIVLTRQNYNTNGMHQESNALMEKVVLPSLLCPAG
ncbi:MAG: serine hydrolase [Pseudomonadota bacterium]